MQSGGHQPATSGQPSDADAAEEGGRPVNRIEGKAPTRSGRYQRVS
jgi:hypothetical protein